MSDMTAVIIIIKSNNICYGFIFLSTKVEEEGEGEGEDEEEAKEDDSFSLICFQCC